ncbi:hypothetical protein DFJ73DRAFT_772563 [Zopfochytrium polystomum]|nr:hypothetical protein DFJ73DRAFT_772563 [Zopfochytrium polystomum]
MGIQVAPNDEKIAMGPIHKVEHSVKGIENTADTVKQAGSEVVGGFKGAESVIKGNN